MAYKSLTLAEKKQDLSSAFRFGLAREFFQGFANEARCNLHLELLYGDEPHHVVQAGLLLFRCSAQVPTAAHARAHRPANQPVFVELALHMGGVDVRGILDRDLNGFEAPLFEGLKKLGALVGERGRE